MEGFRIRRAEKEDLEEIAAIELACFPESEAATLAQFAERFSVYGTHFLVLESGGRLAGFINGMVTDQTTISDDLYEDASLHAETGAWQSVFGLDVREEFRRRGFARRLLEHFIEEARKENRRGVILTCKEHLIHFYGSVGFENRGISESVHGGAVWYDMILKF